MIFLSTTLLIDEEIYEIINIFSYAYQCILTYNLKGLEGTSLFFSLFIFFIYSFSLINLFI